MPFLTLFQLGYLYTGIYSLAQGERQFRIPAPIARLYTIVRPGAAPARQSAAVDLSHLNDAA
jgi:hypothetical protein